MIPIRLWIYGIGAAILLAILVAAGLWLHNLRAQAAKVPGLELTIKQRDTTIAVMKRDHEKTQLASEGYQAELGRLRTVAARPAPSIRVCNNSGRVPAQAAAQPGSDEGASGGGVLPDAPGRDIGPALAADADLADQLSAQVRGLHTYINTVCAPESE